MEILVSIEKIEKKQKIKEMNLVTLSDGSVLEVLDEVLYKFQILEGEMLYDTLQLAVKETKYLAAKENMLKHIRYKDRTFFQIKENLKNKGFDEETIQKVIAFVNKFELADDVAYARKFIKESLRKGNGIIRIKRELQRRGINKDISEKYIQKYVNKEDTYESAMDIARKKLKNEEITEKTYGKIGRYLAMKGFEKETIYKVLDNLELSSKLRMKNEE